jgi:hypothetical protein
VRVVLLAVGLAGAFSLAPLDAQAQDVQVAFDSTGTRYVLDARARARLGLFPEVDGFIEARLFRTAPDAFELVLLVRRDDRRVRATRVLTAAEVQALRDRVDAALARTRLTTPDQDGRALFLASTTALAITEGGLLIGALDIADGSAAATPLLLGAAGFFVPLLLTRNATVTRAQAVSTLYGGTQGVVHGFQLGVLLRRENSASTGAALGLLLTPAEAALGGVLARRNDWTTGHARMLGYAGLSGNALGLGVAAAASRRDATGRAQAASSLAGSLVGAYAGHRLGRTGRYTSGDARIFFLAGVQAVNLVGSAAINDDPEARPAATVLTLAGVGGLGLGALLTRRPAFSDRDAGFLWLSSVAGSLLGGGLALAVEASGRPAGVMQAAGAAAGFGITLGLLRGDALEREDPEASAARLRFDVSVTPSFGAGLPGMPSAGRAATAARDASALRPMVHLHVGW